MALVDLIATGKEAEQLITDNSNLQNQLQTAALQHGNDQQAIADLRTQVTVDNKHIDDLVAEVTQLTSGIDADTKLIADIRAQLAQLQSTVTYPDLEWNDWHVNSNAVVGGSGLGTSSQSEPDSSGWATFGIVPSQPAPNYYDAYFNKRYAPQPQAKTFELRNVWRFDTLTEANASQCLEMEARQVVNGQMIVVACQLDFADNTLRFWDAIKKWTPSGQPMPRMKAGETREVVLTGHRDDLNVYHDSIVINGVKTDLTGTSYIAQSTNWSPMIRPALQLDGEKAALAYKVRYQKAQLKVW